MEHYFKIENGALVWDTGAHTLPHYDDIEMSGRGASFIVKYGADENGIPGFERTILVPTLRLIPNNTHATHRFTVSDSELPEILLDGEKIAPRAKSFSFDGVLRSTAESGSVIIERGFFPSECGRYACEYVKLENHGETPVNIEIRPAKTDLSRTRGTKGVYLNELHCTAPEKAEIDAGESLLFYIFYSSRPANEAPVNPDGKYELDARIDRAAALMSPCSLDTGNIYLDTLARYSKLRAGESIFDTLTGPLHSPGGISYYAASWCNDQIEYAGPWFAYTSDPLALEASLHAYRQYMPFMADDYYRIPSSVISEGLDIWEGAGDRGDAAMYLYGGSLFALTCGSRDMAGSMWDALKWCAEYIKRKTLPEGVIFSDSDELEGRFPTDRRANLSTSCLAFGGLKYASILARMFGDSSLSDEYAARAEKLSEAIESYFGAELHGYHTYRYSAGYDTLRAWICLPICMGIADEKRLSGTVGALLSDYLNCENGMLSCELGDENKSATIWDRALLYAYRAMLASGDGDKIFPRLLDYCESRLTGKRVPYAVEAYPEGGMRHLSGESALFCRMITEGLLAMSPTGFDSFTFIPRLTGGLDHIYLDDIRAFGRSFSIHIDSDGYSVVIDGASVSSGKPGDKRVEVKLGEAK